MEVKRGMGVLRCEGPAVEEEAEDMLEAVEEGDVASGEAAGVPLLQPPGAAAEPAPPTFDEFATPPELGPEEGDVGELPTPIERLIMFAPRALPPFALLCAPAARDMAA